MKPIICNSAPWWDGAALNRIEAVSGYHVCELKHYKIFDALRPNGVIAAIISALKNNTP